MFRKQVTDDIKAVERDYGAAVVALSRLRAQALDDPTILHPSALELADVRRCEMSLETTYLVRLYAAFEEHLRDVWQRAFKKETHPNMEPLLNAVASRQNVPDDLLTNAHRVRDYRNTVVHGGDADYVALPQARQWLCEFFGRMPPAW